MLSNITFVDLIKVTNFSTKIEPLRAEFYFVVWDTFLSAEARLSSKLRDTYNWIETHIKWNYSGDTERTDYSGHTHSLLHSAITYK